MERRRFLELLGLLGLLPASSLFDEALAAPASRPTSAASSLPLPTSAHAEEEAFAAALRFDDDLAALGKIPPKQIRYRIALMTDPHLALRDHSMDFKALRYAPLLVEHHLMMMRHLDRLTGRKVDLLLIPGDLTRDSEPWNHAYMLDKLRKLPFPSLVVPGNHDVEKRWLPKETWGIPKVVAAYRGRIGGYDSALPYYAHEVTKGLLIIGLNTADTPDGALRNTWGGRIDEAQMRWLTATLQRHAGKKLIFVMLHHPLMAHHPTQKTGSTHLWSSFRTQGADEILALLARYDVPLTLCGHHHIQRIQRHAQLPITEVVTSGACSYPSQIRILDIDADGKRLHIHSIRPPWMHIVQQIAASARQDAFWYPPDQPRDPLALIRFLHGQPHDRTATLTLPDARYLR